MTGRPADGGLAPSHRATTKTVEMDRWAIEDWRVGCQHLPEGRKPKASRCRRGVIRSLPRRPQGWVVESV